MAEGYLKWVAGQILRANDLNGYSQNQTVMRFETSQTRDTALTSAEVKEGMVCFLKDTNTLWVNTNGTTGGWVQVYPVVSSGITNATITGSDIASGTITGGNIASGTITASNIQDGSIGASDLAAGTYGISISGNAATATNATNAGYATTAGSASTATNAGYATTAGSASTATSASTAGYATTANSATVASFATDCTNADFASQAGNADTLDTYHAAQADTGSTVAVRLANGSIQMGNVICTSTTGRFEVTSSTSYFEVWDGSSSSTLFRVTLAGVYETSVSGRDVYVNSNGTLGYSSSSERYKEDIQPLTVSASEILKLTPVRYRYKESALEEGSERPIEVGLIAEQVSALGFDEIVYFGKDGLPEGIQYSRIPMYLLNVCKEQQARIDSLEARLSALEAK
jgi:hypothetical protein